jgi:hypothetical protein
MYTLIYNIYFELKRRQKKDKENGKTPSRFIMQILDRIEWFYNIVVCKSFVKHPSNRCGVSRCYRGQKIIVSLTTYPKRIDTVWLTIETLLRQTVKPDEIILWLADSQFEGMESLPKNLLELQKRGLSICFCDDLRSHKKYFYVMQKHANDLVILVDDDMFYPYDTIERLLKMHEKYPNDICTMTAQVITPSFNTKPSEWRNPHLNERFEHSDEIQIFTGSGSLYPPNSLDNTAFDKEAIKKICPYADDLWLTFMAYKRGTKITTQFPWRAFPVMIYGTSIGSLYYVNVEEGQNDIQWEALQKNYGDKMTEEAR